MRCISRKKVREGFLFVLKDKFLKPYMLFSHLISVYSNEQAMAGEGVNMNTLVKKAKRGDVDAFSQLVVQLSSDMYKVARGILNNNEDIADAVQNTILICFEKMGELKQPRFFKTWMTRILINECNKIIRKNNRQCLLEEFPEIPGKDTSMEYVEFQQLIEALDEKYRLVLILYYAEGFKVSEIARLLDLNEGTVKTRLYRGRESLAREYGIRDAKSGITAFKKEAL